MNLPKIRYFSEKKWYIVILFCFLTIFAWSEPDNGAFLSKSPFDYRNLYLEVRPKFRTPYVFFYQEARVMSSVGAGASLSIGYNHDGWLYGLQTGYGGYGKLVNQHVDLQYSHIYTVGATVSKIIGKPMIPAFPYWFAFAPELGAGISIIRSSFYQPDSSPDGKILFTEQGISPYLSVGLTFLFPVHKAVVPYVGIENIVQFVFGAVVYTGSVDLGARIYPFAFK